MCSTAVLHVWLHIVPNLKKSEKVIWIQIVFFLQLLERSKGPLYIYRSPTVLIPWFFHWVKVLSNEEALKEGLFATGRRKDTFLSLRPSFSCFQVWMALCIRGLWLYIDLVSGMGDMIIAPKVKGEQSSFSIFTQWACWHDSSNQKIKFLMFVAE